MPRSIPATGKESLVMSWFTKDKTEEQNSGFWGSGKRVENHQAWEDATPFFCIRAKGREAREQGIAKQRKKASRRTQRNNRREY